MASTMATASSSGPAQMRSSTGSPSGRSVRSRLSGSNRSLVAARSAGSRRSGRARRAEVLLEPESRRRSGRRRRRVVRRRPREARVELGEGREAGAAEAVDRLVVVADDHDVVGPVRRPAEQLDQLDLGDVGVLELVDQDVAELALVAAQDVGPGLEQLRDARRSARRSRARRGARAPPRRRGRRWRARSGAGPRARRRPRRRSSARASIRGRSSVANQFRSWASPSPAIVRRASRSAAFSTARRRTSNPSPRSLALARCLAYAPRTARSGVRLPWVSSRSTATSASP